MLTNKLQEAVRLIDKVSEQKDIAGRNEATARRNNTFFDNLNKLNMIVESYALAHKYFHLKMSNESYRLMCECMEYAQKTFMESYATNPTAFKKNIETLSESLPKEWTSFFDAISSPLLDELKTLVLIHPNPRTIQNCIQKINKCKQWPLTQEAVESYNTAVINAKLFLDEVHYTGEIKEFLTKVSKKTATLYDLSPTVLEWIKNEGIEDKITLGISNT